MTQEILFKRNLRHRLLYYGKITHILKLLSQLYVNVSLGIGLFLYGIKLLTVVDCPLRFYPHFFFGLALHLIQALVLI